ncbi:MAG: type II secretion system GspH family protein [Actinomycetota bacterium]|nr:type II secretion system GspH family protein [Actinomycetota bacterium]
MSARGRRRGRDEEGFTLIEVTVTSALIVIVIAILMTQLTGTLTTFGRQSDRVAALDQETLLLQQIEHDVVASSTLNVVNGNDLQLIAILPSTAGDAASCVEYQMSSGLAPSPLALRRRVWAIGTGSGSARWQTLLTSLRLNGQAAGFVIPNPSGATPFSTTASSNGRSVAIDVKVQNGSSPVVEFTTTSTGRSVIASVSGAAAWTAQCS